jgi:hypothetical protein
MSLIGATLTLLGTPVGEYGLELVGISSLF